MILECGGKRSATPLSHGKRLSIPGCDPVAESGVAAALCHRTPNRLVSQHDTAHSLDVPEKSPSWPHAPMHRLCESGTYFVTAATYQKAHDFRSRERLVVLHRGLLSVAEDFGWQLEAWAVFSNHYHFVAHAPPTSAETLPRMLGLLHEKTAKWTNRLGQTPGRKVWHNYRETRLTYEKSYLARLNYTHQNAVKHRLVPVACQYPWCSAAWFERTASAAQIKTIYGLKTDQLNVPDDFDVHPDW
jgi:putative transposase